MQRTGGVTRSHSANASRRGAMSKLAADMATNKENMPAPPTQGALGDVKSAYNSATGQTTEDQPKRLSGGKRTSSHPDAIDGTTQPAEQKKAKKTYTPHQSKEAGHAHIVLGEDIAGTPDPNRWKILDLLGEGTFAKVVEVWDRKRKVYCAVKVVRAIEKYVRDAKFEINMLHRIKEDDNTDFYPTIKYRSYFFSTSSMGQHMCIVFPKLGFCLLDYLNRCGQFKMHEVAHIGWQMGAALNYLHAHLKLIHTDLKPENILLENPVEHIDKLGNRSYTLPANTKIRIIDFGGATDNRHSRNSVVSTRHYRAPEVILAQGWMWAADMWSTGCILLELTTGRLLFDTHDNREHLALMEKSLGKAPEWYAEVSTEDNRAKFFDRSGTPKLDHKWIDAGRDQDALKAQNKLRKLRPLGEAVADPDFCDLIRKCLDWDKLRRMRAHDLMYHPFIMKHWSGAAIANQQREQHERQTFGHVLGSSETTTRVRDPPYDRSTVRTARLG